MKEKYMREGKRESKQGCEKDFLLSSHGFSFLFLWAQIMRKCGLWDSQKYNQQLQSHHVDVNSFQNRDSLAHCE